jgi:hypothetical protein
MPERVWEQPSFVIASEAKQSKPTEIDSSLTLLAMTIHTPSDPGFGLMVQEGSELRMLLKPTSVAKGQEL